MLCTSLYFDFLDKIKWKYSILAYEPSLTLPRFQVPVPIKKVSGHIFCTRGINFASMILILDFEIASTVWYLFFILFLAGLKF
jgi:hypothetical protein